MGLQAAHQQDVGVLEGGDRLHGVVSEVTDGAGAMRGLGSDRAGYGGGMKTAGPADVRPPARSEMYPVAAECNGAGFGRHWGDRHARPKPSKTGADHPPRDM